MSYYKVDPCDMTCYGNYYPPTLVNEPIIIAECFDRVRCDELLSSSRSSQSYASGVHDLSTGEKIDNYHRSSSYISVDPDIYRDAQDRIVFVVNFHVQPQIGRRLKLAEPLQFLKYDSSNSGHFNKHTDDGYFTPQGFQLVAPQRKFTAITYLNEDYTGGELVIETVKDPHGNHFYQKMPIGSTIIFPSDQRFPHEVRPVQTGTRYCIVSWFDFE